jgi:energy-coupling factor transporter ATP-binding protein EcfA2
MRNINNHLSEAITDIETTKGATKELFLLRGLPGSGKSTLAKSISGIHFEADMYFMKDNKYQFDITRLKDAHQWCQEGVEKGMTVLNQSRIVVSNTFTQEWEIKPYFDLAEKHGYRVYSLIVENRHDGVNEHGVPEDKLKIMKNRFEVKL